MAAAFAAAQKNHPQDGSTKCPICKEEISTDRLSEHLMKEKSELTNRLERVTELPKRSATVTPPPDATSQTRYEKFLKLKENRKQRMQSKLYPYLLPAPGFAFINRLSTSPQSNEEQSNSAESPTVTTERHGISPDTTELVKSDSFWKQVIPIESPTVQFEEEHQNSSNESDAHRSDSTGSGAIDGTNATIAS
jgi:hypothetical protein